MKDLRKAYESINSGKEAYADIRPSYHIASGKQLKEEQIHWNECDEYKNYNFIEGSVYLVFDDGVLEIASGEELEEIFE